MMIRVVMFSAIFFRSGERASGSGNRGRWWAISHGTRCQFMLVYRARFFGHKFDLSGVLHVDFLPGETRLARAA